MSNAQANDEFVKEFLKPHVDAIARFFNDPWLHEHRWMKLFKEAEEALKELEKYVKEPYDPS